MNYPRLNGLVAATYTPMTDEGKLNLSQVAPMVDYLIEQAVSGLYVCGTTGEGTSLTTGERQAVLESYFDTAAGRLPVVVQVGHNCVDESCRLAEAAQRLGVAAVSANAPSYFRPASLDDLIGLIARIAAAAPELPFYYYHIPAMTGTRFDMVELLRQGSQKIPNLAGIKYSDPFVPDFQACMALDDGRFDILWGCDEMWLAAMATGARGAVGSTYNIAAAGHLEIIEAFEAGDMDRARQKQLESVELVRTVARYPFHSAMKQILTMMGFDFGPCRLPQRRLTDDEVRSLRADLEQLGFFDR